MISICKHPYQLLKGTSGYLYVFAQQVVPQPFGKSDVALQRLISRRGVDAVRPEPLVWRRLQIRGVSVS